jgi:isopentenyl phosphate kinase
LAETVFIKLGGSLITDKTQEALARPEVIARMAREVRSALLQRPDMRLLVGHGSGSFGHAEAKRYRVHEGCADWWGYAATAAAADRLTRLVVDGFLAAGVPVVALQPSASARTARGQLVEWVTWPIEELWQRGLVPLVHGDVALDQEQGSAIVSTERLFAYLLPRLRPARIVLVGEVVGVYTADPRVDASASLVPLIDRGNIAKVREMLGGSHGIDVTGGMLSKVETMYRLASENVNMSVQLVSGLRQDDVERALVDGLASASTVIRW